MLFAAKMRNLFNVPGKQRNAFAPDRKQNYFKSRKAKYTVGVDINGEYVCLVKSTRQSNNEYLLVDKKIIKLDSSTSLGSVEFKNFLKSAIVNFCGTLADCDIWTKISTEDVSVNFLENSRVPKNQLEKVIFWTAKKEGLD